MAVFIFDYSLDNIIPLTIIRSCFFIKLNQCLMNLKALLVSHLNKVGFYITDLILKANKMSMTQNQN
jgi:hypothetical protein